MPKVTVIIPCYNIVDYIDRCLLSVMEQGMRDFEIILIDDGSMDGTFEKCAEWKKRDDRIVFVSRKNSGLGAVRNLGISMARGEYVTFLDADDWWDKDYLSEMLAGTRGGNTDIVICDVNFVYENGSSCKHKVSVIRLSEGNLNLESEQHLLSRARTQAWGKVYRRSLFIDNGVEEPAHSYEDVATTPYIVAKARSIYHVPKPLYFYVRDRQGSIINHFPSLDGLLLSLSELTTRFQEDGLFERYYSQIRRIFWGELCFLYRMLDTKFSSADEAKANQLRQDCNRIVYELFPELASMAEKIIYVEDDDLLTEAVGCISLRKVQVLKVEEDFMHADIAVLFKDSVMPKNFDRKAVSVERFGRPVRDRERLVWDLADEIFDKMME